MPEFDKVEKAKRIRLVMEWIIDDYVYHDIVTQIMAKWFIQERQAKRYIADALKEWSKIKDSSIDQKRKRRCESLKKLRRSLLEKYKGTPEGIRAIVAVEKELIKLEGLELPRKVELTGKDGQPIKTQAVPDEVDYDLLTDDVLEAILKARKKKDDNSEESDTKY